MKLAHRLFYYLGGFGIGLILLFFFLGGKKASCDYGPSSRVLKNIRIKERVFSKMVQNSIQTNQIDTADISYLLLEGDVDFSKSNTKLDSCRTYFIEGLVKEKIISMLIENCDSIARINTIQISE
ncbi:DUF4258 domain-containing protein [Aquimarina sp. AD10]|uniref:DUF4258 domain-containing protein n=1 Tax=Aquimarina aggregata TaxID=1642818 RepID=A0A162DLH5_9FLAO|nr:MULTISPECIES: DUF4258 domain-containing protein [Aquimarina]AXT59825.1 DUF4258 domain-containing protein [Aquimarina sp. AD10]KZS42188.1 hypothetical protein AWE51_01725 [Aquimarina aggregata]RKM97696.1 DUF4258 domain-containing protein [Aquimarina sp. AD10]